MLYADTHLDRHDWTLALAGGYGTRLRDYVISKFGEPIPKQYCQLLGDRSMLQHTLDRVLPYTPASRTMTVIAPGQAKLAIPQLDGRCDHVFVQPALRDTGVAVYAALTMIKVADPDAIVTITPTDHYVWPDDRYGQQLRLAASVASRLPDTIILLGVSPTEPDSELGYIEVGDPLTRIPLVRRVRGFVEKPATEDARRLIARGALWSTSIACGSIDAFWQLGRDTQPEMIELLDTLTSPDAEMAAVYRALPSINLSRDVFEHRADRLAAFELDRVEWSDWGRPEQIEQSLALRRRRGLGI